MLTDLNGRSVYICRGLLSAGKRTQSMLDAIGHIDPTVPVYHWKINRCDALLREVMGENLYKEVHSSRRQRRMKASSVGMKFFTELPISW